MHSSTQWVSALLCLFPFSERYDRSNDQNMSKQKHEQQGRHSIPLNVRFKDELKLSDRNSQIERGIAVIPLVLTTTCLMYSNRFFGHISWWVTNWAVQLTSIVSLCLQDCLHQFLPWPEKTIFCAVIHTFICTPKKSPKNGNFKFSRMSRRVRVGFPNCSDLHMHC